MCKGDVLYRALNIVFEVLNDLQVVHNTISLSLSFGFGQDYTKNLQTVYETFIMAFLICLSVNIALTKAQYICQIILCIRKFY